MAPPSLGPGPSTPSELEELMDADRRGSPYLFYRDGDGVQRVRSLDGCPDRLSFGRDPASDVPLVWDPDVSRAHARLERLGVEWAIVDDGPSRNGTFVNGERVSDKRLLADGDLLRFGKVIMTFNIARETKSSETTQPEVRVG